MELTAKQIKQFEEVLRGVSAQLKSLGEQAVNASVLKAFGAELEERILKRLPMDAPGGEPGTAKMTKTQKKHLDDQVRGMLSYPKFKAMPKEEAKALGLTVGEEGGFLVPEEFIAEVDRKLTKSSVIRPNARVFNGVGKKGSMPRETGTVSVFWENENVKSSEGTNPKFGNYLWNLNKLKALTKFSQELIDNDRVDVTDIVSDMISEQTAVEEDKVFMDGSGAGRPTGLRSTPGVLSVAQAGANLAYDDFVNVKHKLPVQYRPGAAWILHNDIIALAAKIKDSDGRPIFLDLSVLGGQGTMQTIPPMTIGFILGHPVLEQNDIPTDLGGGSDESEGWFGNLRKAYFIFDGGTMTMSTTTEGFETFETDQMALKGIKHVDGKGANELAVVYGSGWK